MSNKKTINHGYNNFLTFLDYINPFALLHETYLILKYFIILKRTLNSVEGRRAIEKHNNRAGGSKIRVDNIGRIYTVVNIPIDYIDNEDSVMLMALEELKALDLVLIPLGITDIVVPNMNRKYDKYKDAYYILMVITPNTSFFTFRNVLFEVIKLSVIIGLIIKYIW